MYQIAICDNDNGYIKELEGIIRECNANSRKINFLEYRSSITLLQEMPVDVDAVFLEVQMPEIDGNTVAMELKRKHYAGVMVQSGSRMPTPETVKIAPYRYLLKPNSREKMTEEIQDVLREMDIQKTCFAIEASYQREKAFFRTEDIVYITHHQKGSVLHLNKKKRERYSEGQIITPLGFEKLMEALKLAGFSIPHNSYIVNLRYVTDFDFRKEIIVLEGERMSVSRGMKKLFNQDFVNYAGVENKRQLR